MNIDETITSVLHHYQKGNLPQAESICRNILKKQPDNVQVLHFLGVICYNLGKYDPAIQFLKKALQLNPNSFEGFYNLGRVYEKKGELDEALKCFQEVIRLNPHFDDAYVTMGNALRDKGRLDEAIACYKKIIGLNPKNAGIYFNLGVAFQDKGQLDEAISCYQKALKLNLSFFGIYNNLGLAFQNKGQLDEALSSYQKALQQNPLFSEAHNNMGNILKSQGQLDKARACYQQALRSNPNNVDAYNNLGIISMDTAQPDKAEAHLRRALQINPDFSIAYSNLLLFMNYTPRYNAKDIHSGHLQYAERFEKPLLSTVTPHSNEKTSNRRLKIGYVSPDFKSHSVAYFIEPVLSAHNRDTVEIFCYSDVKVPDTVTGRIQGYAEQWRTLASLPDEKVAEMIRQDGIDILVDLSGHTASNRMLLFARKPAPVQVSWIGYPATTGLSTMDYKIVDAYTDPPGMTEQFYTEELIRMPESFLCYLPDPDSPEAGSLPALSSGSVTFGSFNTYCKVTAEVMECWAEIVRSIPNSRFVMKAKSLSDTATRQRTTNIFEQKGVAAGRIELLSWVPSAREHLALYNRIDIGLDTFPYNGTTTTCEAIWMGVPVVSLAGDTPASRVGISLLSNVGLKDLVATTQQEYIEIALDLAKDTERLQSVREQLRTIMAQSTLTNAEKFTLQLEKCYRRIWEDWCTSHSADRSIS